LWKATITFSMSVCPSVCLSACAHGTTWLPLDRFSWNFDIWVFFENLLRKFKLDQDLTRIVGTLHENLRTFTIIPGWVRVRNVWHKLVEKIKTHFMLNNLFPKIMPFMRWCGKIWYSQTGYRWQYNMAHALCMLDNWGYRHTLRICNTYCLSMATMVWRMCHNVTLNMCCLSR
jgi:hypothetical protein